MIFLKTTIMMGGVEFPIVVVYLVIVLSITAKYYSVLNVGHMQYTSSLESIGIKLKLCVSCPLSGLHSLTKSNDI